MSTNPVPDDESPQLIEATSSRINLNFLKQQQEIKQLFQDQINVAIKAQRDATYQDIEILRTNLTNVINQVNSLTTQINSLVTSQQKIAPYLSISEAKENDLDRTITLFLEKYMQIKPTGRVSTQELNDAVILFSQTELYPTVNLDVRDVKRILSKKGFTKHQSGKLYYYSGLESKNLDETTELKRNPQSQPNPVFPVLSPTRRENISQNSNISATPFSPAPVTPSRAPTSLPTLPTVFPQNSSLSK